MQYLNQLIILIFLALSHNLAAQVLDDDSPSIDSTQVHILSTKNGDLFFGKVLEIEDGQIYFLFKTDTLVYKMADIEQLEFLEGEAQIKQFNEKLEIASKKRKIRVKNPKYHGYQQLLVTPTAFNYKAKEGEYKGVWLPYQSINVGLKDNFSIGFNSIIPVITGANFKYTHQLKEQLHFGAGSQLLFYMFPNEANVPIYDYSYLVLTVGTPQRFLSGSVGYFFGFSDSETPKTAVFNFGGSFQFHPKWVFMLDAVMLPNLNPFDSPQFFPGMMFSWFNHKTKIDFGIAPVFVRDRFTESKSFSPLPIFTYSHRFSNK